MRKWLLSVLAVLGLGVVQAQESYFGVGAALGNLVIPLLSVQAGGPVVENVEVRGTLDSVLFVNDLGLDVLYTFAISDGPLEGYVGGGPDLVWIFVGNGGPFLTAHATAGLEYLTGNLGVYGEAQALLPVSVLNAALVPGKLRFGVNFYF